MASKWVLCEKQQGEEAKAERKREGEEQILGCLDFGVRCLFYFIFIFIYLF